MKVISSSMITQKEDALSTLKHGSREPKGKETASWMLSRYKEAYTDRHRTQVFGSLLGPYCPIYALANQSKQVPIFNLALLTKEPLFCPHLGYWSCENHQRCDSECPITMPSPLEAQQAHHPLQISEVLFSVQELEWVDCMLEQKQEEAE